MNQHWDRVSVWRSQFQSMVELLDSTIPFFALSSLSNCPVFSVLEPHRRQSIAPYPIHEWMATDNDPFSFNLWRRENWFLEYPVRSFFHLPLLFSFPAIWMPLFCRRLVHILRINLALLIPYSISHSSTWTIDLFSCEYSLLSNRIISFIPRFSFLFIPA